MNTEQIRNITNIKVTDSLSYTCNINDYMISMSAIVGLTIIVRLLDPTTCKNKIFGVTRAGGEVGNVNIITDNGYIQRLSDSTYGEGVDLESIGNYGQTQYFQSDGENWQNIT